MVAASILLSMVLFVVVLNGTMWLIARLAGWQELAARHPGTSHQDGEIFRFTSLGLSRLSGYNNCIIGGVSERGISLRVMRPLSSHREQNI